MNPTQQELYDLFQEKLHVLKKARILETDPSRKFKLQKEIEELKAQCEELANQLSEVVEGDLHHDGKVKHVLTENSDATRTQTKLAQNHNTKKLMCLINRHDQLKILSETIEQYREHQHEFVNPLFCVAYGHKEECFDKFLERIEQDNIGKITHLDPITVKKVLDRITLDKITLDAPMIFHQFCDSEVVSKRDVQRILRDFFTEWQQLTHPQCNHPVLFFVFLQHGFTKAWWQFWKSGDWRKPLNNREELARELKEQYGVNAFILPELEPIAFKDVRSWFMKYYGEDYYFPVHTIEEKIYTKSSRLSLYSLIEKLKPLLDSQG
jgi:hypothetical protein